MLAGCSPEGLARADVATAQAIGEMADAVADVREQQVALSSQLDSLRLVVARQDSVLRVVANLAGVSVPPR
jgi:hypothetical protein